MSQIVQIKSPILAVISDQMNYVKARNQIEESLQEHNLTVADMPMMIRSMINQPEVREAIRPTWIDTITGEYHGQRQGSNSYEVWHSAGSLSTAKGLEKAASKAGNYAFMPISDEEWTSVGKGNYNGRNVARVHLQDAKKGNVPTAGTPYTIFTLLDKDKPNINGRGQLDYDTFMKDDRVLMITGSPDNRESLAKMLFGKEEDGGEGRSSIGSYHRINEVGFDTKALGRLVYLDNNDGGLDGSDIGNSARFVGVGTGGTSSAQKILAPAELVQPTLEQTLAVINNADLNREGMITAVSQLYKR